MKRNAMNARRMMLDDLRGGDFMRVPRLKKTPLSRRFFRFSSSS
jgi:hypothetical protein